MSKVGELSKVSKHFLNESVVITSDIWDRDKDYPKQFLPHVGYDYRSKIGRPVYAPFAGEIVQVTPNLGSSYGRQVYVFNGVHTFHTAHYSKVDVKQGQRVKKGDLLGLSGASGASENTYAPHLHAGLAKGIITNAGNKGSFLGDLWVDLESYDFDHQIDYWRSEGGVFELTENVNERSEPSTSGKIIKTHKTGAKLDYVTWGNSPKYTWFKLQNGNYIAYGERVVEVYGKDNPKAISKPVAKPKPSNVVKSAPIKDKPSGAWKAEDGVFILSSNVYERNQPKTNDKSGMRLITKGKQYPYDAYQVSGGYVWLRNSVTGKVIPWRVHNGETWGKVV